MHRLKSRNAKLEAVVLEAERKNLAAQRMSSFTPSPPRGKFSSNTHTHTDPATVPELSELRREIADLKGENKEFRKENASLHNLSESDRAKRKDAEMQASSARHHQSQLAQEKNSLENKLIDVAGQLERERQTRIGVQTKLSEMSTVSCRVFRHKGIAATLVLADTVDGVARCPSRNQERARGHGYEFARITK